MARFGQRAKLKAVGTIVVVALALWLGIGLVRFDPSAAPAASAQGGAVRQVSDSQAMLPAASAGRLILPVVGIDPAALVDTFTQARSDGRVHDAIDIMAPRGTPVVAAASGTVEKLFTSELGGKTIYQRSPDSRFIYYYAHLDAYAAGLAEGQVLRAGATLGTVGSTGNADPAAPHLHFAILKVDPAAKWHQPAIALNPYPLLTGRR